MVQATKDKKEPIEMSELEALKIENQALKEDLRSFKGILVGLYHIIKTNLPGKYPLMEKEAVERIQELENPVIRG